jgi:hypothetical protein
VSIPATVGYAVLRAHVVRPLAFSTLKVPVWIKARNFLFGEIKRFTVHPEGHSVCVAARVEALVIAGVGWTAMTGKEGTTTLALEAFAVVVGEDPAKELGTTAVRHSDATQAAVRATRARVGWKWAIVM